ncbi:probable small nuclear ribonucleoprotein E [Nephila pilipes]|uniref:Small nuclear ribonucleoprotein E n=1 Tax=Nephila pilipes TaxID=299642 RepID=A0A8X6Q3L8_NEPPI|nr:probable small nuclear ribonucleoprotein E [Nephila pilipes]
MASKSFSGRKLMVQPINLIFRFVQNKTRVQIWLYEDTTTRLEGIITGFDEYMNLVLKDTEEINLTNNERNSFGRLMLKGENVTVIMKCPRPEED